MKLVIQIPCLNERDHLARTLADLPRAVDGVDTIEVLVVDDGSTDGTSEKAVELWVHHVVRFPRNRGLAAAFNAGVDAAVRLGADVIVNTDADNQYRGEDIARLVAPILSGRADVVVGDRQTDRIAHFSPLKRALQRWGSRVVRRASATRVADATSGFRAFSRRAALRLFVHNRFTYTLETLIQGGRMGLAFENVAIETNPKTRESRLFTSLPQYLRRGMPVILRSYAMYRPVTTFASIAAVLLAAGAALVGRFVYFYVQDPSRSGHAQSLVVGVGCVILSFVAGIAAMLGELLAANRRLVEEALVHLRRLDADASARAIRQGEPIDGVATTGAAPWRGGGAP
jgi:glycosyltransferase involved in cell wall biosynthesis